jgi:N-acetylglucosamine-6-sulfatase
VGCVSPESTPPAATTAESERIAQHPNIIIVLADELRANSLGFAGHPFIETPHIDRIAHEGAWFENSFVITSLCEPSRATLLTGRYTHRSGISSNRTRVDLDYEGRGILPRWLQAAGYATAFFGKYHLGESCDPRAGFDHWECLIGKRGQGDYFDARINRNGELVATSGFSTDVLTTNAVAWIRKQRNRPFFLLLALKNPHIPFTPPARHRDFYANREIEVPPSAADPTQRLPRYVRQKLINRALHPLVRSHDSEHRRQRGRDLRSSGRTRRATKHRAAVHQ